MKLHSKLTVIGSVAALATSPLAFANKEAPVKPEAAEVVIGEEVPDGDEVVVDAGETSEEIVIDETVVDLEDRGSEGEVTEGEAIPLDWVKRGDGENPDVIFYNMAGGEAPVFKGETAAKAFGQDEKAVAIEAQDAPVVSPIQREKKAPVALIKKGRVFLR